jgi:hypothetical protein
MFREALLPERHPIYRVPNIRVREAELPGQGFPSGAWEPCRNAFAVLLVTLLGAAGEALGIDRTLKANTVKTRTLSLFRQECRWFAMLAIMPLERLRPLLRKFRSLLASQRHYKGLFGPA